MDRLPAQRRTPTVSIPFPRCCSGQAGSHAGAPHDGVSAAVFFSCCVEEPHRLAPAFQEVETGFHHLPLLRSGLFLASSQRASRLRPGGKSLFAAPLQLLPAALDAPVWEQRALCTQPFPESRSGD